MHKILTGPLSVEKLTVPIADLPRSLHGTKLVQLSDLHYDGLRLSDELLEEAIAICNEAEPDLVVLTGDYVTDEPTPIHQLILRLKHLQSRAGICGVLGNHDISGSHSKDIVTKALTSIGVQVLWNEVAYPLGSGLAIAGLADSYSRAFKPASVMNQIDPQIPRIVLSHNPDTAHPLQQWRADLILSGHTHGGQIVLPGIGPAVAWIKLLRQNTPRPMRRFVPFLYRNCFKVVRHWEWAQGFHQVGKNRLYVNRGLGTYLPGRLFCPPEVTLIELVAND